MSARLTPTPAPMPALAPVERPECSVVLGGVVADAGDVLDGDVLDSDVLVDCVEVNEVEVGYGSPAIWVATVDDPVKLRIPLSICIAYSV